MQMVAPLFGRSAGVYSNVKQFAHLSAAIAIVPLPLRPPAPATPALPAAVGRGRGRGGKERVLKGARGVEWGWGACQCRCVATWKGGNAWRVVRAAQWGDEGATERHKGRRGGTRSREGGREGEVI